MSTDLIQSAIQEVRDQISLDYADGEYLSAIGSNLGIDRPPFGFSDDTWRAVLRALSLTHKQIRQKFRDLLSIVFGPQVTQGTVLAKDASSGDRVLFLRDTTDFPQVGKVTLDEGLSSEETLEYSFIDKTSNKMYLNTPLTFGHRAREYTNEQPLLIDMEAGDKDIYLPTTNWFPSSDYPYTVVLSRGKDNEESLTVIDNDLTRNVLVVYPTAHSHKALCPCAAKDKLSVNYEVSAEYLKLFDTSRFPAKGYILTGKSFTTFTATGGALSSVTVSADTFTDQAQVGNLVVFTGNVTPALAGVEATVISNTDSTVTFKDNLAAVPAAGDTFSIRVKTTFVRNDSVGNVLYLAKPILDVTFSSDTEIELLSSESTALLAPVKIQGTGWDVIQSNPKLIELLIPPHLQDTNTVRSASYLHSEPLSVADAVTTAFTDFGDKTVLLTAGGVLSWPPVGLVNLGPSTWDQEVLTYRRPWIKRSLVLTGSTQFVLNIDDTIPDASAYAGQQVLIEDTRSGLTVSKPISSISTTSITLAEPLTDAEFSKLQDGSTTISVLDGSSIELESEDGCLYSHPVGSTARFHQVLHSSNLVSGDVWNEENTFPGPYLYDIAKPMVRNSEDLSTTLTKITPFPTRVAVTQTPGRTALEVLDALSFDPEGPFPIQAVVGREHGAHEVLTIHKISLAQRTASSTSAASAVGDTTLLISSLTPFASPGSEFPDSSGYRVLVDPYGPNEEVLWVRGTQASPPGLIVDPMTKPHASSEFVGLVADVLTIDPLDTLHKGIVKTSERTVRFAPVGVRSELSRAALRGATSVRVVSSTDFIPVGWVRIDSKEYPYSLSIDNTLILTGHSLANNCAAGTPVYLIADKPEGEVVEPLVHEIKVTSTAGFPSSGGSILVNFGNELTNKYTKLATNAFSGSTVITVVDSSVLPTTYPFEVIIGEGTRREERLLITHNDTTSNELTIDENLSGVKGTFQAGTKISFYPGLPEEILYQSTTSTSFRFSPPIVLKSKHQVPERVLRITGRSTPRVDGYDFPLRMPTDVLFRLRFLLDLIRAAGVQLVVIDKR